MPIRFSNVTRCATSSRRSSTRRWVRCRATRGWATHAALSRAVRRWNTFVGLISTGAPTTPWTASPSRRVPISAVDRDGVASRGRLPLGYLGGGHRPHLVLHRHGYLVRYSVRCRGVDRSAGNHPRPRQATVPLVFRDDAMPLEAPRHAVQSPLPRVGFLQSAERLVFPDHPGRADPVGRSAAAGLRSCLGMAARCCLISSLFSCSTNSWPCWPARWKENRSAVVGSWSRCGSIYRPLLSWVVWKSIYNAARGVLVGWGKLERTAAATVPSRA